MAPDWADFIEDGDGLSDGNGKRGFHRDDRKDFLIRLRLASEDRQDEQDLGTSRILTCVRQGRALSRRARCGPPDYDARPHILYL